jgi:hypothetical protein
MELVAYELACAETHERAAAKHRRDAMSLQAAVHAEFKAALTAVQDRSQREIQKLTRK